MVYNTFLFDTADKYNAVRSALMLKFDTQLPDISKLSENQGWAATFTNEVVAQQFVGGMQANYQRRENQPVDEDYLEEKQHARKIKSRANNNK
jgi:hypothetical protein